MADQREKAEEAHFESVVDDIEDSKPKYNANRQLDDAARILAEAGPVEYSAKESRRVLWKIDLFVCLPMCMVYCCQQLDKSTLGYSAVFGLREETGLVGTEYSWLTSIVYFAQLFTQPLSAYALIVFPVKWWVVFNFAAWSITTICTAAAKNFAGLMVARLFLGIFEATILPSFIFITQMWYTRREHAYRTTAYQVANSLAPIIGPLITWGVGHVNSGIRPYQAIFITIGAISLFFVPIFAFMMPNSPTTARFLRHGDDRLIALHRIRENNMGTKSSKWDWAQFRQTYKDPKTYMWGAMFFLMAVPPGGLGAFGGLLVKGLGFTDFDATLMQMPTGGVNMVAMIFWTWLVNKVKLRWPVASFSLVFSIFGGAVLARVDTSNISLMMVAYYSIFLSTVQQLLYSWANLNASGSTKRVVTTATMFACMCAGNIVGPQVYLAKEAPHYRSGLYTAMSCWAALAILIVLMGLYLQRLNKRQEARREALGLPAKLKDISLMSIDEAEAYKVELMETLRASGNVDMDQLYANSFDDMTDFENPMFIYVP